LKSIRIVLADDHALVRAGFRSLLEQLGAQVIGEAKDGREAVQIATALKPDVVLMDISMPGLNGLEATTRLVRDCPGVRVIILSMHASAEYARRAVRAGALGYLLKDSSGTELEMAIRAVAAGKTYLSPGISTHILSDYSKKIRTESDPLDRLTTRQREILQLIAEGHARKEIAKRMNISVKTFDTYRAQLMDHLDIHDVAGLVRFAARAGLIDLEL